MDDHRLRDRPRARGDYMGCSSASRGAVQLTTNGTVRIAVIGGGHMANDVHLPLLASLAESNRVITQVSHQRRSAPLISMMRQKCLDRGAITHAVCEFYKYAPSPHLKAYDHVLDDCIHAIDTVRSICDGDVVHIYS